MHILFIGDIFGRPGRNIVKAIALGADGAVGQAALSLVILP